MDRAGRGMSSEGGARHKWAITVSVMLATLMAMLDQTIANVALPHIQGSVSASLEQIGWVLTSYILATAAMTPLTGWLSGRFSRKLLFLVSILGFTVSSMLCGMATSLTGIVAFRLLQGMFGAPLMPMSQAMLLDIHPPDKHAQAMALWGVGTIFAPVMGPVLGGWLTENLSWRWVFFINLPVGLVAATGVWLFVRDEKVGVDRRLDFLGFGSLVVFIGALQLALDRGPSLDWFSSSEIWIEVIVAAMGLWVFLAHTLTAREALFDRRLGRDRNFVSGMVFGFFLGIMLNTLMALLPTLMQQIFGYPVLTAGIVSMPRGVGSLIAMLLVAGLSSRTDPRFLMLCGMSVYAAALWRMLSFDTSMSETPFLVTGLMQGIGLGLIFVPLTALTFATLNPALRAEGAAAFSMVRSLGASVGISVMQALLVSNTATMHSSMAARVIPSDPVVQGGLGERLGTEAGLRALDGEITRQAAMVAYLDIFRLLLVVVAISLPLLLILRRRKDPAKEAVHVAVE